MSIHPLIIKVGFSCSVMFFLGNVFYLNSCTSSNQAKNARKLEGELLVQRYCTSCHVSISPDLLDKETWQKSVLPAMGKMMGISMWSGQYFPEDIHAGISIVDWQKIVAYFSENAPEKLPVSKPSSPIESPSDFLVIKPLVYDTSKVASTTMVKFNPDNKQIYVADISSLSLHVWDNTLKIKTKHAFESPVVDVVFFNDKSTGQEENLITTIGVIKPEDFPRGKVQKTNQGDFTSLSTLAEFLPRPVKSLTADFNKDGLTDILVCGFGNTTGGLYLLAQLDDNKYEKVIISPRPGAIKTEIRDFNNDGWPDIMCLFAQGDEGIWMYLNDQNGGFSPVNVLRFPPVYGSSSFQLVDFNNDGFEDILYTAGDNSDYSRILKPYHGVYIFSNNGKNRFKQSYFKPINGSTKAIATDLNKDDKLDLVTIVFFADGKNNPRESFMYFMQGQENQFTAYTLPIEKLGKWLCMDVNDFDQDGFPDIILGNFSIEGFNQPGVKSSWDTRLPFIVLKNQFKKIR